MKKKIEKINTVDFYKKIGFLVTTDKLVFKFDYKSALLAELYSKKFAIITAANTTNEIVTEKENLKANRQLLEELEKADHNFDMAAKYSFDQLDLSFCVYDMEFEEAISLGRAFSQHSIFYADGIHAGFYQCKNGRAVLTGK